MGVVRKALSKLLRPLDRFVTRRVQRQSNDLGARLEQDVCTHLWRIVPKPYLQFEVHLAEHCNLNCRGCNHFSPLAKEELLDIDEYTRDCERLSALFHGEARRIALLGGEPLLNPKITDFMRVTHRCFPRIADFAGGGGLFIVTNGIRLTSMSAGFWEVCRECNVAVYITHYPIELDYNAITQTAKEHGVVCSYYHNEGVAKKMFKWSFDVKGTKDPSNSFFNCVMANDCITLKHGKLYTCPPVAHMHILNETFNTGMELSEGDYIDIYKVNDAREILRFVASPVPFCRYCDVGKMQRDLDWATSKKDIDEWV